MAKINRVGTSFSTLPFDGIDNVANVFIHEDFVGVSDDASGVVATANGNLTATSTAVTAADGTADHPGIVLLEAGFMVPGDDAEPSVVLGSEGVYVAAIAGIEDVSVQDVFLGLSNTAAVIGTQSYVGIESDGSDGEFQLVADDGTNNEVEAFDLYPADGDWFVLEVAVSDEEVIGRVTTADGQETRVLELDQGDLVKATLVANAFFPLVASANSGALALDALHVRAGRGDRSVAAGAAWLDGSAPAA